MGDGETGRERDPSDRNGRAASASSLETSTESPSPTGAAIPRPVILERLPHVARSEPVARIGVVRSDLDQVVDAPQPSRQRRGGEERLPGAGVVARAVAHRGSDQAVVEPEHGLAVSEPALVFAEAWLLERVGAPALRSVDLGPRAAHGLHHLGPGWRAVLRRVSRFVLEMPEREDGEFPDGQPTRRGGASERADAVLDGEDVGARQLQVSVEGPHPVRPGRVVMIEILRSLAPDGVGVGRLVLDPARAGGRTDTRRVDRGTPAGCRGRRRRAGCGSSACGSTGEATREPPTLVDTWPFLANWTSRTVRRSEERSRIVHRMALA